MRLIQNPWVGRDLVALVDHIVKATQGDYAAVSRRLAEVDAFLADILTNPRSGMRLAAPQEDWLVLHGWRGHSTTIVFRADMERDMLYVALVAFGGQDWMVAGEFRKEFGE